MKMLLSLIRASLQAMTNIQKLNRAKYKFDLAFLESKIDLGWFGWRWNEEKGVMWECHGWHFFSVPLEREKLEREKNEENQVRRTHYAP